MADLFTIQNLGNLGVLIFLQVVLGFDNLLYISIESQRAPEAQQAKVRRNGILIALVLRIVLLVVVVQLVDTFKEPFFTIHSTPLHGSFNFSTLVFLLGGGFIMYTAVKEISHLLSVDEVADAKGVEPKPARQVIAMIVLMNLIFSFDSILSALAITKVVPVLALAIVTSALMMLVMSDSVSSFLKRNRQYEVLGLFILLIVGVVLLGEGGHEAHMKLFGYAVEPMSKATFYFSMAVLVAVDVLQSKYQKALASRRASQGSTTTDS